MYKKISTHKILHCQRGKFYSVSVVCPHPHFLYYWYSLSMFFRVHLSNMICTDTGSFQNGSQREGINNQQ